MRLNIKEIINELGCSEEYANDIEMYIDQASLIYNWNSCTKEEAKKAYKLADKAIRRFYK